MKRSNKGNPIPSTIRSAIIGVWIGTIIYLERRSALRPVRDSKLKRDTRNLAIAASAGLVMQVAETPVAFGLAEWAAGRGSGLIRVLSLPRAFEIPASVLLLDYTLYAWHVLTHRVAFLWRFHQVHHLDREMDATTALRFHFGEIASSVLFRAVQVLVFGPSAMSVAVWQLFLFVSILFHHSNLRIPLPLERRIARLVMTPRLHGIHHSTLPNEVNSNWSSGFIFWDWLHSTLRTEVPQARIVIGVPGYLNDEDQSLSRALTLPWREPAGVPPGPPAPVRQSVERLLS